MRFNPFKLKELDGQAVYLFPLNRVTVLQFLPVLPLLVWLIFPTRKPKSGRLQLVGWLYLLQLFGQLFRLLWNIRRASFARRAQFLQTANLQPGSGILEVGCRDGFLTIGAVRSVPGLKLVAVDNWLFGGSEEAIRSNTDLEEIGGRVRIYEANPWQLPFGEAEFDILITNEYLTNFAYDSQQIGRIFAEFRRVLKPAGRLVIGDTNHWLERYAVELTWAGFKLPTITKPAGFYFTQYSVLSAVK